MVQNLENEIWKPVVGYEGKYEVSNLGRVKSLNYAKTGMERLMKPSSYLNGYLFVNLRKDWQASGHRIHRLVYEAFRGKLPKWEATMKGNERWEVNHINEVKTDNRLENLELVTCTQNNNHGTHGKKISLARTETVYQYTIDGKLVNVWDSAMEYIKLGYRKSNVCACCKKRYGRGRKSNKYKGYIWSRVPLEEGGINVQR